MENFSDGYKLSQPTELGSKLIECSLNCFQGVQTRVLKDSPQVTLGEIDPHAVSLWNLYHESFIYQSNMPRTSSDIVFISDGIVPSW